MEIKDCPFCGMTGYITDRDDEGYSVDCDYCRCHTPNFKTEEEAITAWNKISKTESNQS